MTAAGWCRRRRETARSTRASRRTHSRALRDACPDRARDTIAAAERVLRHEFDLLGSGPFVPVDPDRRARGRLRADRLVSRSRPRLRFPARRAVQASGSSTRCGRSNADIKYPWELGALPALGDARPGVPADRRRAVRARRSLASSTISSRPIRSASASTGPARWTSRLRAVSWAIGFELVRAARAIDDAVLASARTRRCSTTASSSAATSRTPTKSPAITSSATSSGSAVRRRRLRRSAGKARRGRRSRASALEQEIDVQVLPDGADYESSIPYHRLVAELFLGAAAPGRLSGAAAVGRTIALALARHGRRISRRDRGPTA